MIKTIGTNTNPTNFEGASHTEDFSVTLRQETEIGVSFNLCDYECAYEELKFSESGPFVDDYKNDFTDLLFQLSLTTDTIVIELWECLASGDVLRATITDDTYGIYFAPSFFPDQKKVGFLASWNKIYNAFGEGKYYFKSNRTLIGQADSLQTWNYKLQEFSEEAADNTVKIISYKNGVIARGVDYTGFTWRSEIRFKGVFGRPVETLEQKHYQTQDRIDKQNRDKITTVYSMETELTPYKVINPFVKDGLLANNMYITPYSIQAYLPTYKQINVAVNEIEEPTYYEQNTNRKNVISFRDKVGVPVKTNFN